MSARAVLPPLGSGLTCRTLGATAPKPDGRSTSVFEPAGPHGSAVPLIAAPPLGLDGRCYSRLAPLAAGRRTIFWNLPNRLPTAGGPAALGRLFLEHADRAGLSGRRLVLCGGSLGGVIAMAAAVAAPERTAGLVIFGTAACWRDLGWMLRAGRWVHPLVPRRRYHEHMARILVPAPRGRPLGPDAEALRTQMRHRTKAHVGALIALLTGQGPYDLREEVAALDVPLLLIHGERDPVIASRAPRYFERLPHGRVVMAPGVSHLPQVSAPDLCLAEIEPFLGAIDRREETA